MIALNDESKLVDLRTTNHSKRVGVFHHKHNYASQLRRSADLTAVCISARNSIDLLRSVSVRCICVQFAIVVVVSTAFSNSSWYWWVFLSIGSLFYNGSGKKCKLQIIHKQFEILSESFRIQKICTSKRIQKKKYFKLRSEEREKKKSLNWWRESVLVIGKVIKFY